MNEIVNKFLLAKDEFCGPFNKNKERIQKFKETGYIYQNKLDKG